MTARRAEGRRGFSPLDLPAAALRSALPAATALPLGAVALAPLPLRAEPVPADALPALAAELPEEGREERLRELFGVNRILLGSTGTGEATLVLRDGEQRPRIVLGVPEEGEPYVRVLDEAGEPVAELP